MSTPNTQITDLRSSNRFIDAEQRLAELQQSFPGDGREWVRQSPLFVPPHVLRRMLFFDELYKRILSVHGTIIEFGVRFGRDLATLDALRTVHEPLNHARRIVGFDTFTGFPSIHAKDGSYEEARVGGLHTGDEYDSYLNEVLACREQMAPYEHIRKFEIRRGDATKTFQDYLTEHPETIVAFAYFDFDIYEPTKVCLELLRERLTKGSVVAFDELNNDAFPGETVAVREVFGLDRYAIQRIPHIGPGDPCFLVIE